MKTATYAAMAAMVILSLNTRDAAVAHSDEVCYDSWYKQCMKTIHGGDSEHWCFIHAYAACDGHKHPKGGGAGTASDSFSASQGPDLFQEDRHNRSGRRLR